MAHYRSAVMFPQHVENDSERIGNGRFAGRSKRPCSVPGGQVPTKWGPGHVAARWQPLV